MRQLLLIALAVSLSGCSLFTKTVLVPQPVMPSPPALLMQPPKELKTISGNITVSDTATTVKGPVNNDANASNPNKPK
jgi:hypothetical protein